MNTPLQHKKIYLDYASSTPVDEEVLAYMGRIQSSVFGNAQAIHSAGRDAKTLLEASRKTIGESIGAHSDEIIFTSGGTESDNLALLGVINAFKKSNPDTLPHVIISAIEHPAVYEVIDQLYTHKEIERTIIPVDTFGIIDVAELKKAIRENTTLISVMHANNEIGTIQPIEEIAKVIRHYKKHRTDTRESMKVYPLFHTDACQSFVYEKIKVESLGVDMLSINSSKLYGPKGVGVLFIKRRTPIESLLYGGSQEKHLRAGTENVPLIASFAKAISINEEKKEGESERLKTLRENLWHGIQTIFPQSILNGHETDRLPNNINITIPHVSSEQFVIYADSFGILLSEKSACKTDATGLSHVIIALRKSQGISQKEEEGSIRFSLGRFTTQEDIQDVLDRLQEIKNLL